MSWLYGVQVVAAKELRVALASPAGWVFLVVGQVFTGLFFVAAVSATGEASLRPVVPNLAATLLFCVPFLTMGQLAGEERRGTLEVLLTSPVPLGAVVLGKWAATQVLCSLWLVLSWPVVWALMGYGDPDLGVLASCLLALWLCGGLFAAVGLFASSLTREPMVAAVLTVGCLLPSWLAGAVGRGGEAAWVQNVSFVERLRPLLRGQLVVADLAWFVVVGGLFLVFTWQSLSSRRWR